MKSTWRILCMILSVTATSPTLFGATATFTPQSSLQVERGTPISFDVVVSSGGGGFNSADVIIGSNTVADIDFTYSAEWLAAFSNVSPITFDNGFYAQDVFAGGNHTTSVGVSLPLGVVTIDTTGMPIGLHTIAIDNALDGVSTLGLDGVPEPLSGSVVFEVTLPIPATSTWGLVTLALGLCVFGTVTIERNRHRPAPTIH